MKKVISANMASLLFLAVYLGQVNPVQLAGVDVPEGSDRGSGVFDDNERSSGMKGISADMDLFTKEDLLGMISLPPLSSVAGKLDNDLQASRCL